MHAWSNRLKTYFFKRFIQNTDDLYQVLTLAQHKNIISHHSWDIINSVVQIVNIQVRDVMTPRNKMISIDISMNMDEILKIMSDSAHSRFPVFNGDQIQGILLAKDVLNHFINHPEAMENIGDYLRPHITVPESKSLETLLKEFQSNKNHMALVVDEYKTLSGVLTIEDVIEQIVGEIEDEHDFEEDNIIDYGQGRHLVRASTTIEEFNKFFNSDFSTTTMNTISGIVLSGFERMPDQLETIELSNFVFKILKSDDRRLILLEVSQSSKKVAVDSSDHKDD